MQKKFILQLTPEGKHDFFLGFHILVWLFLRVNIEDVIRRHSCPRQEECL